jgi:hypothetical protein
LFACPNVWEKTFKADNKPLPGMIKKRMNNGHSVWLNVKTFGAQPEINKLSSEE